MTWLGPLQLQIPRLMSFQLRYWKELSLVLDEVEYDESVRVIVIHGEGQFFSAGADIKEFTALETSEQFSLLVETVRIYSNESKISPKPIIAAIHGAASGGGLELSDGLSFSTCYRK